MKLYPLAPDASAVAKHFERMARGELQKISTATGQVGFGGYTQLRASTTPVTVNQITPVEVGVQQAKSELKARQIAAGRRKVRTTTAKQTRGQAKTKKNAKAGKPRVKSQSGRGKRSDTTLKPKKVTRRRAFGYQHS